MATVGVVKVASALNLDPRRVQQLVKEGMPRQSRGRYDPVKCMLWYVRYLQGVLEKRSMPTPDGGERSPLVRLLRAQADLKEMELARQQSAVIPVAVYESTLDAIIQTTTSVVMAIAPKVATEIVGNNSRVMVQALIEKRCKEALSYLAKPENHKNSVLAVSPKRVG